MDDARLPSPDDDPSIADAAGLFQDAPDVKPRERSPASAGGESYDLDPGHEAAPPPVSSAPDGPSSSKPVSARAARERPPERAPDEAVRQVWSRLSEWGMSLLIVGAAWAGVGVLVYLLVSMELYGIAFLTLMSGMVAIALLLYPVLITLERPVRVTPEQAVRDFYGALSHHLPHHRRMWLLLSDRGKYEGVFATYDGFRNYWKQRTAELKRERALGFTPLRFLVDEYSADKSTDRTEVNASFTVRILVRGRQAEGPVESIRVQTSLVRGPDRMWYLDRGTLP